MKTDDHIKIQNAVNHRLAGLSGDPLLALKITQNPQGKVILMKKKLSLSLAFVLALVLLAATALAANLLFSPRYDATRLANEALKEKYGITDNMMTVLYRESKHNEDGSATVTYQSVEKIARIGVYTVTVKNGKADATWSLDGTDTAGGLEAKAWGAEQIGLMLTDYAKVMGYLANNQDAGQSPVFQKPALTEEERAIKAAETKILVLKAAKITLEDARLITRQALMKEYELTPEQEKFLAQYDGEEYFEMDGESPLFTKFYHLSQGQKWMEKDGIYVVTINLMTGEIEDIIYDSTLAGNG